MMKKYAKVIDEKTKMCEVGLGTNSKLYISLGMKKQNVEQANNGFWYLEGYLPEKKPAQKIEELKQQLADTDWYIVRFMDAGTEIPPKVKEQRQNWRDEINRLQETQT